MPWRVNIRRRAADEVPATQKGQPLASANAGSSSLVVLGVRGPAWLRSPFGVAALRLKYAERRKTRQVWEAPL